MWDDGITWARRNQERHFCSCLGRANNFSIVCKTFVLRRAGSSIRARDIRSVALCLDEPVSACRCEIFTGRNAELHWARENFGNYAFRVQLSVLASNNTFTLKKISLFKTRFYVVYHMRSHKSRLRDVTSNTAEPIWVQSFVRVHTISHMMSLKNFFRFVFHLILGVKQKRRSCNVRSANYHANRVNMFTVYDDVGFKQPHKRFMRANHRHRLAATLESRHMIGSPGHK